jgi:hypothetical protein
MHAVTARLHAVMVCMHAVTARLHAVMVCMHAVTARRTGGGKNKAGFIRQLIEREKAREWEKTLLEMFNQAAADVTSEDLEERESLLGGFASGE